MFDDNDFKIQRRNLILMSTILLIFSFAEVDIDKIKLLEMTFTLDKEINIKKILLLLESYFIIRYITTLITKLYHKENIFLKQYLPWELNEGINKRIEKITLNRRNLSFIKKMISYVVGGILSFISMTVSNLADLFNKAFYDYLLPIYFSIFSTWIFISNKKILELDISTSLGLGTIILVLFISSLLMHIYESFLFRQKLLRDYKNTKRNQDYYKKIGKSKKRKDNI